MGVALWWYNLNAYPTIVMPAVRLPVPNAFDYYAKAGSLHARLVAATPGATAVDAVTDPKSTTKLTPQQLARRYPTRAKLAWLRTNAAALQLLREGFAHKYLEPPQHPLSLASLDETIDPPSPHYTQLRAVGRLLLIESHARAERGDWAGAARTNLDILHLGHDLPRGGPLLAALVGYAIDGFGRKELTAISPHLDARTAHDAATQLERLEANRVTTAETLLAEKWYGQRYLQSAMRQSGWRYDLLKSAAGPTNAWAGALPLYFYSKRKITNSHAAYLDAYIAQARLPYAARKTPPPPATPLHQSLLPSFEGAFWHAARDEAGNLTLIVQLALHAFKLEHGRFPATLQELTPTYLTSVPRDPFGGGEVLRYRLTGTSYLLYSIGPDRKDDGGRPMLRPGIRDRRARYLTQPDSLGDFVAGVNW
jgi:hypothetical protein